MAKIFVISDTGLEALWLDQKHNQSKRNAKFQQYMPLIESIWRFQRKTRL